MEDIKKEKIMSMLRSGDKEMEVLGITLLSEELKTWEDYVTFRSVSNGGKPVIPKHLRKQFRAKARDLESRRLQHSENAERIRRKDSNNVQK